MIYYFQQKKESFSLPCDWQKYLPSERIEKVLAFRRQKDADASFFAFLLLRYALYKEYADLRMPQLITDENGKPFLPDRERHFNLSHCDTAVACALDCAPIGVDVQNFQPVSESVIKKVCSSDEGIRLQVSDCADALFAAFWAAKEAYGKCKGCGIGYDLKSVSFCPQEQPPFAANADDFVISTDLFPDFALSVCSRNRLRIEPVSFAQLQEFMALL